MLMTMKNSPDAKYCGVLAFNEELVTLQQIKNALKNPNKEVGVYLIVVYFFTRMIQ
jgi:hypothetical protein